MYYAKAQGRNLVHIYNKQSIIQKSIDIEKDIQEIEQQLKKFSFPKTCTRSSTVSGYSAMQWTFAIISL